MQNDSQRASLAFQTFQMQLESILSMYTNGYGNIMDTVYGIMKNAKGSDWITLLENIDAEEGENKPTYSYVIPAN